VLKKVILLVVLMTSVAAFAAETSQNPPPKPSVTERCRIFLSDWGWAAVETLANVHSIMTYPFGMRALTDAARFPEERMEYNKAVIFHELLEQSPEPYIMSAENILAAMVKAQGATTSEQYRNFIASLGSSFTFAAEKRAALAPKIEALLDSEIPEWRKNGINYFEPGRPLRLYTPNGTVTKKFEYGSYLVIASNGLVLGQIEYQPAMKLTIFE
jgi:hypothetical protein